jgi:NTE family protein
MQALVLGSGGFTGVAWEAGVLRGLQEAGVGLDGVPLVIGSSAGAIVGAWLLSGRIDELFDRQVVGDDGLEARARSGFGRGIIRSLGAGRRRGLGWVPLAWAGLLVSSALARYARARGLAAARAAARALREERGGEAVDATALARIADLAIVAGPRDDGRLAAFWGADLGDLEWPSPPAGELRIVAVDGAGEHVTIDRSWGCRLADAVAASTSVAALLPASTVAGRRYIDGGTGTQTNALFAAGRPDILVVAPVDRGLEAGGARVTVIRPSAASEAAKGTGVQVLDPARRAASARAGVEDGRAAAASIAHAARG